MPGEGLLAPVRQAGAHAPRPLRAGAGWAREHLDAALGGPARRHVVVVLACVLAVAAADQGAMSSIADQLQHAFGISRTALGLLGTITTAVSAVATLPFGMYVDRVDRTRLLGWTTLIWSAAMIASAAATSYLFLLLARVVLGVVIAVAYPATASLLGDWFAPEERGRIYGYVLSGELLGTGLGIVLAGAASSLFGTWRAAMLALVLPAAGVTWLVLRLPEPARGGAGRLHPGQRRLPSSGEVDHGAAPDPPEAGGEDPALPEGDLASRQVRAHHVRPRADLVLNEDPVRLRLPVAVVYVLRIRTNVIVILASALGYFFFSGLRFFAIEFVQGHYGISRGVAFLLLLVLGIGALAGALTGGRVADRLLRSGRISARVLVPAGTLLAAALLLAPGIVTTSVGLATGLFVVGAGCFTASNPPLDAARLDVVPSRLWGRAESVRTVFRGALEAAAPVTFGLVADNVFGGQAGNGLRDTFLVMLVPLVLSSLMLLLARRTYPRDVATASASEQASRDRR